MFVANPSDKAALLASWSKVLTEKKLDLLQKSKGWRFYEEIFSKIDESDFAILYSKKQSAANSPVNRLVGAFLWCHHRNWTHQELAYELSLNVEVRISLGLLDLEEEAFTMRTFYNFRNRLAAHYEQTGENLLQKVFDKLTLSQLNRLGINTTIQRVDSVLLNSSIQSYSRLSLLVEVLSRLYRILSEKDKVKYETILSSYKKGGEQYVYEVRGTEQEGKLAYLAPVYHKLYEELVSSYDQEPVFQVFARVYEEHFKAATTSEDGAASLFKVELKSNEELSSGCLQSPDDLEATYRNKRKASYKGYLGLGIETCHPDNELNLVVEVDAASNNTDDAAFLVANVDKVVAKTPAIEEMHQDGGFGSEQMDQKAAENGIALIQTAVKGRGLSVEFTIEGEAEEGYEVSCPNEKQASVKAQETKKNYKACFDTTPCMDCPFKEDCPAFKGRNAKGTQAVFRFSKQDAARQKRNKAIQKIPPERKTLRSGVENLMGRMHRGEKHTGKLRIRGLFNCKLYVIAMGIVVNFERIFNYLYA